MRTAFTLIKDVPKGRGYAVGLNQIHTSQIHRPEPLERRESSRFPIQEELQYRVVNRRVQTSTGVGRTIDMSSSGILFQAAEAIPLGRTLEVSVDWPARLGGICLLKLVATGPVVRSEGTLTALRIQKYEFRTRGIRLIQELPEESSLRQ